MPNDNTSMTTQSQYSTVTSSPPPPYPTFDLHINTKWALVGFLVISPIMSVIFLVIHMRMERKKTNILNIQLALVNLLSSVILLPMFFSFYQLFSTTGDAFMVPWKEDYVNASFCGSLAMTFYVLTSLHFTTLFALSLDRMIAVYLPFKYRRIANLHYICGLATLWALTLTLPLLGFFVIVDNPIEYKEGGINTTIQRRLFQFLPHGIENDQNVFCEIYFPTMAMEYEVKSFNITDFDPDTPQKVYCFFMMMVPYVVVPLLTVIVGIMTMFKIGTLDFKRKSLKYGTNKRASIGGSFLSCIFRNQENRKEVDEIEMVYENKNHQHAGSGTTNPESMTAVLKKIPSKRRINSHYQALATVIMLMVLFCLCDLLWWIINVSYVLKYIFNKSILSISGMFSTRKQQVVFPIVARFGIFVYNILVPLLMIWRQKPLRDESMAMFRNAKSRNSSMWGGSNHFVTYAESASTTTMNDAE